MIKRTKAKVLSRPAKQVLKRPAKKTNTNVCKFDKAKKCFVRNGQTYKGVHRYINERFWNKTAWPNRYDFGNSNSNATGNRFNSDPKKRGIKVHKDLQRWIDAKTNEKRKKVRLHPMAQRVIEKLAQMKLEPIQTEYVVWTDKYRIATAIDIVCQWPGVEGVVPIEVKTFANKNEFYKTHGKLRSILQEVNQSHCSMAQVQLALSCLFLKAVNPKIKIPAAFVIRADTTNAESIKLSDHIVNVL
jgi:hypothetical protein